MATGTIKPKTDSVVPTGCSVLRMAGVTRAQAVETRWKESAPQTIRPSIYVTPNIADGFVNMSVKFFNTVSPYVLTPCCRQWQLRFQDQNVGYLLIPKF